MTDTHTENRPITKPGLHMRAQGKDGYGFGSSCWLNGQSILLLISKVALHSIWMFNFHTISVLFAFQ